MRHLRRARLEVRLKITASGKPGAVASAASVQPRAENKRRKRCSVPAAIKETQLWRHVRIDWTVPSLSGLVSGRRGDSHREGGSGNWSSV